MRFRISVFALLFLIARAGPVSAQEAWPVSGQISPFSKVSTVYTIKFRGFKIGSMKQLSRLQGNQYEMKSATNVSLLAWFNLDWKWKSNSKGILTSQGPRPFSHAMTYTRSGKPQSYDLAFTGNNVSQLITSPQHVAPKENIPVTDRHFLDVIDPLSAFLMLTLYDDKSGSPCNQAARLFDGKLRFNVTMSPKRVQLLKLKTSAGRRVQARVCSAKWDPVAGHKPGGKTTAFVARTNDIEVYLIPVEGFASHYVPYLMSVPTPYGTVTLTSVRAVLTTADDRIISMIN